MATFWLDQPVLSKAQISKIALAQVPVDEFNPSTYWIACLEAHSLMPTPKELAMIRSYIEFFLSKRGWVGANMAKKILSDKFAALSGVNTVVLRKAEDGWYCRRITWDQMWSRIPRESLLGILDNELTGSSDREWAAWKASHKTTFA
jgi:hypothetical protein